MECRVQCLFDPKQQCTEEMSISACRLSFCSSLVSGLSSADTIRAETHVLVIIYQNDLNSIFLFFCQIFVHLYKLNKLLTIYNQSVGKSHSILSWQIPYGLSSYD